MVSDQRTDLFLSGSEIVFACKITKVKLPESVLSVFAEPVVVFLL